MADEKVIDSLDVSRRFIDSVLNGPPPPTNQLAKSLDELAYAYQFAPVAELLDEEDDSDVNPPANHEGLYSLVAERFPDLGPYSVADPFDLESQEVLISDAIDDIRDILIDLQEVVWRADNQSENDARWYFRMLFEIHWGMHLRQLSLYLHAK